MSALSIGLKAAAGVAGVSSIGVGSHMAHDDKASNDALGIGFTVAGAVLAMVPAFAWAKHTALTIPNTAKSFGAMALGAGAIGGAAEGAESLGEHLATR